MTLNDNNTIGFNLNSFVGEKFCLAQFGWWELCHTIKPGRAGTWATPGAWDGFKISLAETCTPWGRWMGKGWQVSK